MTITFTPSQAIIEFFSIRGEEGLSEQEIAEAVAEIGNPDANLHVAKTAETADDFRANGWQDHADESGIVTLRKQTGNHRTPRGMKPTYTYANIADCGDYRLVYVERG